MRMGLQWRLWLAGVIFAIVQPLYASDISNLTVVSASGQKVILSEDELLSLPQKRITTSTAWTQGTHLFEGVALGTILRAAGIDPDVHKGATVRVIALNDYVVDFPLSDVRDYDVLIAIYMDGERLSVSDKGPYWVVYPRDDFSELRDSRYDHRWAWQLKELQIR